MAHQYSLLATSLIGFATMAGCKGNETSSTDCSSGKCDTNDPPALEVVALASPVTCEIRIDTSTTDPFFQVDELHCSFAAPPQNNSLVIDRIFVDVERADGVAGNTFEIAAGTIGDAPVLVSRFHGGDYPIEVRSTVVYELDADQNGDGDLLFNGARKTVATRPASVSEVFEHTSPFDLWPLVLWPDTALDTAWEAGQARLVISQIDFGFPIASAELNVGGVTADTEVNYRRTIVSSKSSVPAISSLRSDLFFLPLPKGDVGTTEPAVTLTVADPKVELRSRLGGPGYYVIDREGRAVLTAPADLPGRKDATPDAGVPDGGMVTPDAEDPDPCNGTCSASDVCVAAACVTRANQTQSTSCNTPFAVCDPDEDGDCAPDHSCVAGTCRRLTCQTQSTSCNTPFAPCDGESSDCGEGHACVANLCRRLTCQTQSTSCNTPFAQCDGEDTDCASEHACVEGLCRRLSCQTQSTSCNTPFAVCAMDDDGDCGPDHACVAGTCRRLTCQTQSTSCNTPFAPCDNETSDCATDHACQANLCTRNSCL